MADRSPREASAREEAQRPRWTLVLELLPVEGGPAGRPPAEGRRVAALLKHLLRRWRMRCVSVARDAGQEGRDEP